MTSQNTCRQEMTNTELNYSDLEEAIQHAAVNFKGIDTLISKKSNAPPQTQLCV
jgi:hypothetical protein